MYSRALDMCENVYHTRRFAKAAKQLLAIVFLRFQLDITSIN